jgi:hypothetical protein
MDRWPRRPLKSSRSAPPPTRKEAWAGGQGRQQLHDERRAAFTLPDGFEEVFRPQPFDCPPDRTQ